MVNPARIILASILLGFLLLDSSSNPFGFVPHYIDLSIWLELLCCIAVSGAICYVVAVYWRGARVLGKRNAAKPRSFARTALKALRACVLAFSAYMGCAFLALLFFHFIGFDNGIAVAYTLIVIVSLILVEIALRRLLWISGRRAEG